MFRLGVVFACLLGFAASAGATLAPRKEPGFWRSPPRGVAYRALEPQRVGEYRLTGQSEVRLDGRPCRYEDVPDGAQVIYMEIDSRQSRAILRIHFRSK